MLIDYAVGAFVTICLLGLGAIAFSVTGGAPKPYELRAIGGVYTQVLAHVEASARELRSTYCADAAADPNSGCHAAAQLVRAGVDGAP